MANAWTNDVPVKTLNLKDIVIQRKMMFGVSLYSCYSKKIFGDF